MEGITNSEKVIGFLENEYRWSSLWDYLGKSNFSSVSSRDFLLETIGRKAMKENIKDWISYKNKLQKSLEQNGELFLE